MKLAISLCTFVLGVAGWLSPAPLLQAQELKFKLDHFKVYRVQPAKPAEATVALKGQFDKEYKKARIAGPMFFANPVSKDRGEIQDPNAHLNWYRLRQREQEPLRKVEFENQFGRQTIVIGPAALLAVPTKKAHEGKTYPVSERLDHYKVYRVMEGQPVGKKVTLVDQFGDERNVAIRPTLFCVPVSKQHGDRTTKIVNERDHLVVYLLDRQQHEVKFETSDQFGTNTLKTTECVWLCVPSAKRAYKEVPGIPERGPEPKPPPRLPEFRLDHFKVYEVKVDKPHEATVALKGQFDRDYLKAQIGGPVFFANVVSKNGARLKDPNAHLNWYKLAGDREPRRRVAVVNQFGEQKFLLDQPAFLLAPTKKSHEGKDYPLSERLDHFKAYEILEGEKVGKKVTLVDQFGDERNVAVKPVMFCVPVAKRHGDRITKIVNPRDHLVVYELERQKHEIKFKTSDQFGENEQATTSCIFLCVPTAKLEVTIEK